MSLSNLPPGSESDTSVVTTKVIVNGTELSGEVLLIQFSVQKFFNKISGARLLFQDGNVAEREFSLSNEDNLKPGSAIEIKSGYEGQTETIFEGIIIGHKIQIKPDGNSYLHIEAKDEAIKLTSARKSAYFIEKKDSEVMEEILDAAGLKNSIDRTNEQNEQLVQYNATDWDFLAIRAEANGMFVFTDNGEVTIAKPDTQQKPILSLTYGDNILDFEAELDARRQHHSVTAATWDYRNQEMNISDQGSSSFSETGNLTSDNLASVLGSEPKLVHTGKLESSQLQDWANAQDLQARMAKVTGRVRVLGNATIKPGTMIELKGVGDRFNGNVFVTGVVHLFTGNLFTDIHFGWGEDPFYKKEDVMDKAASGLLPGVNGLEIGIVEDTDDPEGQYRIKIKLPSILGGNEGVWARVAMPEAGSKRGIFFRPEVDDEVVLGFLNDDPNYPVVLGSLYSSDSRKPPLEKTDSSKETGIVTGEKSKLVFNDSKKSITISAGGDGGEKTIILNDSGSILIKDDLGNKMMMGAAGITIESSGTITIKGALVKIN
ncbi:MAG: type VI secretion system tip protein VgrG [Ginsengibacter sp.]